MAVIETKYSVGDVVFYASTQTERKQHPCPDCNGTKRWKAISPAGGEYDFGCPRCATSYRANDEMSLDYSSAAPVVRSLTIGSVQFNSAHNSYDSGARYMCLETGVGSGSVYNEVDLFLTHEDAFAAAQTKADVQNTTTEWIVKRYNKSLEISDYQLDSATMKIASDTNLRARELLWNVSDLFAQIEEADDKDAILEAVNDYKNFNWARDKAKISAKESDTSALGTEDNF